MDPRLLLQDCVNTITERGVDYGDIEQNFDRIAAMASVALMKTLTPYDVAIIFTCTKIARMRGSPGKSDNYIDGISYLAFAHELRPIDGVPVTEQTR
jgi:hypothetical protein